MGAYLQATLLGLFWVDLERKPALLVDKIDDTADFGKVRGFADTQHWSVVNCGQKPKEGRAINILTDKKNFTPAAVAGCRNGANSQYPISDLFFVN